MWKNKLKDFSILPYFSACHIREGRKFCWAVCMNVIPEFHLYAASLLPIKTSNTIKCMIYADT